MDGMGHVETGHRILYEVIIYYGHAKLHVFLAYQITWTVAHVVLNAPSFWVTGGRIKHPLLQTSSASTPRTAESTQAVTLLKWNDPMFSCIVQIYLEPIRAWLYHDWE